MSEPVGTTSKPAALDRPDGRLHEHRRCWGTGAGRRSRVLARPIARKPTRQRAAAAARLARRHRRSQTAERARPSPRLQPIGSAGMALTTSTRSSGTSSGRTSRFFLLSAAAVRSQVRRPTRRSACLASSASHASMACGQRGTDRVAVALGRAGIPVAGKVGHLHQVVELVGHQ